MSIKETIKTNKKNKDSNKKNQDIFDSQTEQKAFEFLNNNENFEDLDITHISLLSGGYIAANYNVFDNIPNTSISREILKEAIKGTPLIKIGSSSPRVMVIAGMHGNEIPPQIAAMHLIHKLAGANKENNLKGTVYIVPFSAPKSTMLNSRWFDGVDLNRVSTDEGSVSNSILAKIKELKIKSVGDFHSTALNSMPGKEGIFCAMNPSPESFHIGKFIADSIESELLFYHHAGKAYQGTIEDECNMMGIPAVTCEVLSPNGLSEESAYERSLEQMESYLSYFGIISNDS